MLIKDIFERPIDRNIDTVIVAGQNREEKIFQELDEYVVTDELLGHFKEFFEIYSNSIENPTNDIGVWISGFYGSGKSHFLKILSYLLINKEIMGKKPIDYFVGEKFDDESLIENLNKSLNVKNDVVLFNVASKASPRDTIIDVFFKVFNDLRGYSNKFINIEKALDEENKFEEFKQVFEKYEGKSWESKRQNLVKYENFKRSLIEVGFTRAEDFNLLINKKDYDFTPENLAKEVNEYCEKNNTHILFFIDEIGQFISEYSDLMLELQSIVEELAKECNGKAWVIVTSQDTLLNMTNIKDHDFSKIQARFNTHLPLSSSKDDEIIKKRLLEKNDEGKKTLENDFERYGSSLKNILTFIESSEMKIYSSSEDYISNYPLIPYQFNLLQHSLIQIRENSAMGAGVAHGARSMIHIIQETIKENKNNSTETIIPFYNFYNHIMQLINQEHVMVINNAENNGNLNDFDVNVLKTLFLIKYVSDSYLKPNLENISTLMISNVNEEKITLKNEVKDSLDRLIKEVFVNKKGDCYYYLTTKQQEVNKEINSILIDEKEKHKFLLTYIKDIFKESFPNKFEYQRNYKFSVNVSLDDLDDVSKDLGLSFLSSNFEGSENLDDFSLKNLSYNKNFAIIRLSEDSCLFDEINGILQIKDFLKGKDIYSREQVECEKQEEVFERENKIKSVIEEHILKSSIYIWGEKVNLVENDTKNLFKELLNKLFESVYYNFNLIPFEATKEDIFNALKSGDQESLVESENQSNALYDLENYIRQYDEINILELFKRYENAPFGFKKYDISFLIAKLFSSKKISLILSGKEIFLKTNNLQKILDYITLKDSLASKQLSISIREEIDQEKKKSVRNIYKELTDGQVIDDLEGLMSSFKEILKDKIQDIDIILNEIKREERYPGQKSLSESKDFFEEILSKNTLKSFYEYIWGNKEKFNQVLEILETVFGFYTNQKEIFKDSLLKLENYERNSIYIDIDSINNIIKEIKNIVDNDYPYSDIPNLKQLNERYDMELNKLLESEREPILLKIEEDFNYLMNLIEESDLKPDDEEDTKNTIRHRYDKIKNNLLEEDIISNIIGKKAESNKFKEKYIKDIKYLIDQGTESESFIVLGEVLNDEINIRNDDELQKFLELIKSKIERELEEYDVVRIK